MSRATAGVSAPTAVVTGGSSTRGRSLAGEPFLGKGRSRAHRTSFNVRLTSLKALCVLFRAGSRPADVHLTSRTGIIMASRITSPRALALGCAVAPLVFLFGCTGGGSAEQGTGG